MRFMSVVALAGVLACAYGQEQPVAISAEIQQLRKELAQTASERQKNREEAEKDAVAFKEYRDKMEKKVRAIRTESDSVQREITVLGKRIDSLTALIGVAQSQRKQVELRQDQLRSRLSGSVERLSAWARPRLAPLVAAHAHTSMTLIKTELADKSIDNVEAVNRLAQVCNQLEDAAGSIQASQETSPAPEPRGTVYRLRIGHLFESVVDLKAQQCAVWDGNGADGAARWTLASDAAAQVYLAANIREGKALPSFVTIPLAVAADTARGAR